MRLLFILAILLSVSIAQAETKSVTTPSGSYLIIQQGSTTQVIQTAKGSGPTILPLIPITTGSTGWGTVITSQGSYITNGTTVIQTSKGK